LINEFLRYFSKILSLLNVLLIYLIFYIFQDVTSTSGEGQVAAAIHKLAGSIISATSTCGSRGCKKHAKYPPEQFAKSPPEQHAKSPPEQPCALNSNTVITSCYFYPKEAKQLLRFALLKLR
jgi:hypothetical protein